MSVSPSACTVAAVQMVSGPRVAENCSEAGRWIAQAAGRGASLVVLPEYFPLVGMSEADKIAARERDGSGPIQDFLAETAAKHRVWIIGGSLPLVASVPDKVRNACLVYDAAGRRVARYDKIHLFGFQRGEERYKEDETIEAGERVVTVDWTFGRIGLSICYDVRFPEMYRAMGPVDLIALPAAFTYTTGKAHWELLIRTRAVENQCYVIAAAQGGRHPSGRLTYGDSMVVDPWGEILDRLPSGPGLAMARFDPARTADIRASLPALDHRRLSG